MLKDLLKKLDLNKIKEKLPPQLQKFIKTKSSPADDDGEETSSDVGDKTTKINLASSLNTLKEDTTEANVVEGQDNQDTQTESGTAAPAEDEKKKKRSKQIRQVVMIGLALYIVSEFIWETDEAPVEQKTEEQVAAKPKKSKDKSATPTEGATDSIAQGQENQETKAVNSETKEAVQIEEVPVKPTEITEQSESKVPPVEMAQQENMDTSSETNQQVAEQPVEPTNTSNDDMTISVPDELKIDESATDVAVEDGKDVSIEFESLENKTETVEATTDQQINVGEDTSKAPDDNVGLNAKMSADNLAVALGENKEKGLVDRIETVLTKRADKEAEHVPAPDYQELGRGLVYNCSGKHWACINKDSYLKCHNNSKWAVKVGSPKECVPVAVYASQEDCEIIQIHNINTYAKTEFCQ